MSPSTALLLLLAQAAGAGDPDALLARGAVHGCRR